MSARVPADLPGLGEVSLQLQHLHVGRLVVFTILQNPQKRYSIITYHRHTRFSLQHSANSTLYILKVSTVKDREERALTDLSGLHLLCAFAEGEVGVAG